MGWWVKHPMLGVYRKTIISDIDHIGNVTYYMSKKQQKIIHTIESGKRYYSEMRNSLHTHLVTIPKKYSFHNDGNFCVWISACMLIGIAYSDNDTSSHMLRLISNENTGESYRNLSIFGKVIRTLVQYFILDKNIKYQIKKSGQVVNKSGKSTIEKLNLKHIMDQGQSALYICVLKDDSGNCHHCIGVDCCNKHIYDSFSLIIVGFLFWV